MRNRLNEHDGVMSIKSTSVGERREDIAAQRQTVLCPSVLWLLSLAWVACGFGEPLSIMTLRDAYYRSEFQMFSFLNT